jgi:RNA polymerase sigma factor (sigma-70 family)
VIAVLAFSTAECFQTPNGSHCACAPDDGNGTFALVHVANLGARSFLVTAAERAPSKPFKMNSTLAQVDAALVARAAEGDGTAVTEIVRALQKPVYGIALRMLLVRGDAEDATQEALIRVVTRLAQFRGESAFSTWAYRIAVRRILDFREQRAAAARLDFAVFSENLADGRDDDAVERAEDAILHQQLKLMCSRALLQCLDGEHRIAFVLGEIVGLSSDESAVILEIEPATFRKRLSRARAELGAHLEKNCGVVNPSAPCACHRRLDRAISLRRIDPSDLEVDRGGLPGLRAHIQTIAEMKRVTAYYRDEPELVSKKDFVASTRALLAPYKEGSS